MANMAARYINLASAASLGFQCHDPFPAVPDNWYVKFIGMLLLVWWRYPALDGARLFTISPLDCSGKEQMIE
jgi:hypothetical protein